MDKYWVIAMFFRKNKISVALSYLIGLCCFCFGLFLINPPFVRNGYKLLTYFVFPLALIHLLFLGKYLLSNNRVQEFKTFFLTFLPWLAALLILLLIHRQGGFSGYFIAFIGIALTFLSLLCLRIQRQYVFGSVALWLLIISIALIIRICLYGEASEYFGINRNWLMGGFSILLAQCIFMLFDKKQQNGWLRRLAYVACLTGFIALGLSQVRTALLGIMAVIPTWYVFGFKASRKSVVFLILCGILVLTCFILSGRFTAGLDDLEKFAQGNSASSWGIRLELWKLSICSFLVSPLVGWGPDALRILAEHTNLAVNLPKEVSLGTHFHSDFFNILAFGGLLGIAGWFGTIFLMLKSAKSDPYRVLLVFTLLFIGLADCYWTSCKAVLSLFLVLWTLLYLTDPSKSSE